MIRLLRRFRDDRRGVAAIEFALIFPMIFVLNIAAAEALQVYRVQRAVAHMAATMSDITAQGRTVTEADLQDILSSSTVMIYPFPAASLQQRISSLVANSSGSVSIDWSAKKNYVMSGNPSVPAGYLGANESVIVTDVVYDYRPSFGLFLPESIRLQRKAYARPRLATKVEKTN
ncbi:MAG: TadE/TadG family type IV pilus assembly protein [Pseudomonadota bacterium]